MTLAVCSSTGFASATFSTSGFGASVFGALRMPWVICEKSASEMMSVEMNSGGVAFSGLVANVTRPHASTAPCKTADMVHPAFMRSRALLDLRHQCDAAVPGGREPSHHAHHCTVIHLLVATHIDALVIAATRLRDRLQLRNEVVDLDLGVLQVDLRSEEHTSELQSRQY